MVLAVSMGSFQQTSWTGTISISGNEPFTLVTLTDPSGHRWRLEGPATDDLRAKAQGLQVRVHGSQKGTDTIEVERWELESA
jgi:hypothetical protein